MKKIQLFLCSALFFAAAAQSQITKGNWLVGGSASFSSFESKFHNNGSDITQTGLSFQINPNVGYFFVDKLAVGILPAFGYYNPSGSNNNSYSYGFGPFIKYYFLKPDKLINPFAQASFGFNEGRNEASSISKSSGYDLKAGTAIFFNSSVALEVAINYDYNKIDNTQNNNISLAIGFQIHLEKN